MYRIIFPFLLLLSGSFVFAQYTPANKNLLPNNNLKDTFRIKNYPLKIWYGSTLYKKPLKLEPVVLSKKDPQIEKLWKNGKLVRNIGFGVTYVGVGIMALGLIKDIENAKNGTYDPGSSATSTLRGAFVYLGGAVIALTGTSSLKKALRRYNDLQRGQIDFISPIPLIDTAKITEDASIVARNLQNADKYYSDKNYTQAFKILKANIDDPNFTSEHMNTLGKMFFLGQGTFENYTQAKDCFTKAAEKGNAKSMYNLGIMYYEAKGVVKDYAKAYEWFKKSADLGNVNAMNNLAEMEKNGLGITK